MKHISYSKMSKKHKRIEDNKKRAIWSINPITRKPQKSCAYDRNKEKAYSRKHGYADYVV